MTLNGWPPIWITRPERVDGAEQAGRWSLLHNRDRLTTAQLGRGERAAGRDAAAENFHEAVVGTEHAEDARVISAVSNR